MFLKTDIYVRIDLDYNNKMFINAKKVSIAILNEQIYNENVIFLIISLYYDIKFYIKP